MSNRTVYWIIGAAVAAILLDLVINSGAASKFLVLKLFDLVDYVMFWR